METTITAGSIEITRIRLELGNGIASLLEPRARDGRIDPKVAASQLSGVDAATFSRWLSNSGDRGSAVGAAYHADTVLASVPAAPRTVSDARITSLISTAKSASWSQRDATLAAFFSDHIDALTPKQAARIAGATHYIGAADPLVLAYLDHHRATLEGDAAALRTLKYAKSFLGMSMLQFETVDRIAAAA